MSALHDGIREKLRIRRDRLPHWQFGGSTYFVTFCSARGSLPDAALEQITKNVLYEHGRRAVIHFGSVMPDHCHLLIQPAQAPDETWHDLSLIMKSIKGVSSRRINQLLGTTGRVWQEESFDRIVRDENEFLEKLDYIWWNPVKAGLVADPRQYKFHINPLGLFE